MTTALDQRHIQHNIRLLTEIEARLGRNSSMDKWWPIVQEVARQIAVEDSTDYDAIYAQFWDMLMAGANAYAEERERLARETLTKRQLEKLVVHLGAINGQKA